MIYNSYILNDRVSGKWEIEIFSGNIFISSSVSTALQEPIILDSLNGLYYKLFISNGILGLEETLEVKIEDIVITDSDLGINWLISSDNGSFNFKLINAFSKFENISILENFQYNIETEVEPFLNLNVYDSQNILESVNFGFEIIYFNIYDDINLIDYLNIDYSLGIYKSENILIEEFIDTLFILLIYKYELIHILDLVEMVSPLEFSVSDTVIIQEIKYCRRITNDIKPIIFEIIPRLRIYNHKQKTDIFDVAPRHREFLINKVA